MNATATKSTLILLAPLLFVPLTSVHAADEAKQKPNIIFILFDDLGDLSLDVQAKHHNTKGTK